jgi:vacuolar-type H+-ATPase subunit F/Vma7
MAHTVRILCRPDAALGFALAGVEVDIASTPAEGAARAIELAAHPEVGVLLLDEDFYLGMRDSAKRALERRGVPMIVPFPGPVRAAPEEEAEAYLVEILRRAIGYRVRIR